MHGCESRTEEPSAAALMAWTVPEKTLRALRTARPNCPPRRHQPWFPLKEWRCAETQILGRLHSKSCTHWKLGLWRRDNRGQRAGWCITLIDGKPESELRKLVMESLGGCCALHVDMTMTSLTFTFMYSEYAEIPSVSAWRIPWKYRSFGGSPPTMGSHRATLLMQQQQTEGTR